MPQKSSGKSRRDQTSADREAEEGSESKKDLLCGAAKTILNTPQSGETNTGPSGQTLKIPSLGTLQNTCLVLTLNKHHFPKRHQSRTLILHKSETPKKTSHFSTHELFTKFQCLCVVLCKKHSSLMKYFGHFKQLFSANKSSISTIPVRSYTYFKFL